MTSSVFVRNLPYGITQEELERIFSEVGPVKKVDVIKEKGKRKDEMLTRGFAFVKFAMESDAKQAIKKLNHSELQGRKMLIEIAKEKGSTKKTNFKGVINKALTIPIEKSIEQEKKIIHQDPGLFKDPISAQFNEILPDKQQDEKEWKEVTANKNIHLQSERNARRRKHRELLRQVRLRKDATATAEEKSVVIYGLGEDISEKQLYKKIKKVGPLVKVEINVNAAGKRFATAQFKAISFVEIAHKKLDNHTFKGSKMKVRKLASSSKTSSEKEGLRLIIRNLSFEVDDAALEKVFTEYGPLYEAQVVRMPVGDGYVDSDGQLPLGRSRGFGFVQFRDVDDARVAVEKLNGFKLKGRAIVVDFAMSKAKYLKEIESAQEDSAAYVAEKQEREEGKVLPEDISGELREGGSSSAAPRNGSVASDMSHEESDEKSNEEFNDQSDQSEDDHEVTEARTKLSSEDTEDERNRTIFIRNLSFQSTEEGLKTFFSEFGRVEYARIVYDKGTGLSKGVAFIRFRSKVVADSVLAQSINGLRADNSQHVKNKRNSNFNMLTNGDGLVFDGRELILSRSVSKNDADRLAEENKDTKKTKDKRNLYLAHEGTIQVNKMSEEELNLPKIDIEKRRRAIREKKEKLQNPLFFVSPIRLSVRNLAPSIDDKKLKEIFRDGAISGMRENLVDPKEVKVDYRLPENTTPVKVKMAKVLRDMDSVKPGKEPRSRGFGFVEFTEHVHALAALRALNNNPKFTQHAMGSKKSGKATPDNEKPRLIVEFALENHGKLKLREKRLKNSEKQRKEEKALQQAQMDSESESKVKRSRGKRQRMNKVMAKANEKQDDAVKNHAAPKKYEASILKSTKRMRGEDLEEVTIELLSSKAKKLSRKESKRSVQNERKKEESFDDLVRNYKRDMLGELDNRYQKPQRWFD